MFLPQRQVMTYAIPMARGTTQNESWSTRACNELGVDRIVNCDGLDHLSLTTTSPMTKNLQPDYAAVGLDIALAARIFLASRRPGDVLRVPWMASHRPNSDKGDREPCDDRFGTVMRRRR